VIVEQYRLLARYNTWMNERLYALAATLSDTERRADRGAFFRSIHGTFNHLLLVERVWLHRLTGDAALSTSCDASGHPIRVRTLDQELYADFEVLRHEQATTDAHVERWTDGLDPTVIAGPIRYRSTDGTEREHPYWQAVTHLFNHQTHHRGQLTTLFSQIGHDPGVTDLIRLAWEWTP
jgi:uncharacterized damage-inducible protein DinB